MTSTRRPDGPLSVLGLTVIAATIVVDQATKTVAEAMLPLTEAIPLVPILSFYRIHNPGIAFSLLAGLGGFGLILLTLAISVVVIGFWSRATEGGRIATIGYALILGGAFGNLVDRLLHGHVVDFLLLHFGLETLFVFNLADAALTVGPVLLLYTYVWPKREDTPATG
jgi:signal peptidase II